LSSASFDGAEHRTPGSVARSDNERLVILAGSEASATNNRLSLCLSSALLSLAITSIRTAGIGGHSLRADSGSGECASRRRMD
jgi:hypothetical protein